MILYWLGLCHIWKSLSIEVKKPYLETGWGSNLVHHKTPSPDLGGDCFIKRPLFNWVKLLRKIKCTVYINTAMLGSKSTISYSTSVLFPNVSKGIYTLPILQALFGLCKGTPSTVLKLGPWNFQRRWGMVWGWSTREDFCIPPPEPAPGSKRCLQIRSGGPSAYFRASFAKYKLLGILWGVI